MIKKFGDFDKTQAYTDSVQLPKGAYVCRIMAAKVEEGQSGQYIKIAFDIAEGEYAGFYAKKFDANQNEDKKWPGTYILNVPHDDGSERDGWSKRRFKTFTDALEESNKGYVFDWDETKFKDKLIGFVFNYREYEFNGRTGMVANAAGAYSIQDIRSGKYRIPNDRLLDHPVTSASPAAADDFVPTDNTPFEIPF